MIHVCLWLNKGKMNLQIGNETRVDIRTYS